jgi:D-aminopeptidase
MVYSKSGEDFDLPQLDSGIDGLFLLGFHGLEPECGHGHSYRWPYLVLNGKRVGEITIQILLAASKGVPTLFFAGDRFGAQEAQSLVAGATIISLRSGQKADEGEMDESVLLRITDAAVKAALQNPRLSPPVLPGQYELGAPMRTAKEADEAEKLPFPVRRKDQTIFCDFSSFPEMYRFLMVDLWQSCSRATRPS